MFYPLLGWLAVGAHSEAEREHARAAREWFSLGNSYGLSDFTLQFGQTCLLAHRGNATALWAAWVGHDARFHASSNSRVPFVAATAQVFRACAAASLAVERCNAVESEGLLQIAERALRVVHDSPWKKWLLLPRTAAACARGNRELAERLLLELDSGEPPPGFGPLHTQAIRRRRGALLGGDEGKALIAEADAFFRAGGAVDPEHFVATFLPGCEIR